MKFKLRCSHNKVQTITNIYGDLINSIDCRSVKACVTCGKLFYNGGLDHNCHRVNRLDLTEFHLYAESIDDISDGYHTFNELYYHRMILFSVICNSYSDLAWKSKQHDDGTMYNDYFIVGINTPEGQFSYHYNLEFWDMFKVKELFKAPPYDEHKPKDISRLISLVTSGQASTASKTSGGDNK